MPQGAVTINVDLSPVTDLLLQLLAKVGTLANQADVDALAVKLDAGISAITGETGALNTAITDVGAELTALQQQIAAGNTIDLTALSAKVDALAAAGAALTTAVQGAQALDTTVPPAG